MTYWGLVVNLKHHGPLILCILSFLFVAAEWNWCQKLEVPIYLIDSISKFDSHKNCVDFITTVCAGKLTPCAKVFVAHRTCRSPLRKRPSTRVRSFEQRPALWKPTENEIGLHQLSNQLKFLGQMYHLIWVPKRYN